MEVVKKSNELSQEEPVKEPVPPLVEYMRNAHIYGWPLSSTDVIAAYKKYPEHFQREEKEIAGRSALLSEEQYEDYLTKVMDAYDLCKTKTIRFNPKTNYKIEQRKFIMDNNKKLQNTLFETIKAINEEYFPKPKIEINEPITENTEEHAEHN